MKEQVRHFHEAENVWVENGINIMAPGIVAKEIKTQFEDEKIMVHIQMPRDDDDDADFESRYIQAKNVYQMAGKDCPRCGNVLYTEHHEDIDYPFYCPHCQENVYNIEV